MCFPCGLRPASNIVLRACAKAARIVAGLMTDYGENQIHHARISQKLSTVPCRFRGILKQLLSQRIKKSLMARGSIEYIYV
jgi:hypothetical protein